MGTFQRGDRFAGHEIVRLLGAGRTTEVYEVIGPDGRHRALKVSKRALPLSSKSQARLGQEGEVIAMIEHLNVVGFYGAGIEDGRVWILLELVEGTDLRAILREAGRALPAARAVRLIRQAAEGLAVAHTLKIIHRALKPENILVAGSDLVKVSNFRAAKIEDWGLKTTTEQAVRSSLYTAPEYMVSKVAGPWSDVYSLAIMLYELAAGVHPIQPGPASLPEICMGQMTYDPPPLAALGRNLPGDLSDLVRRGMAKDPARRPEMRGLADELGGVLHGLNAPRRVAARALPLSGVLGVGAMMFGRGGSVPRSAAPGAPMRGVPAASGVGSVPAPSPMPSGLASAGAPKVPAIPQRWLVDTPGSR